MWIVTTFEIAVLFLEKKKLCVDYLNLIFLTKLYNTKYTFPCTFTLCNASLKQTLLRCPSHYIIKPLLSCQQVTVTATAVPGDWSCSLTSSTSHYPAAYARFTIVLCFLGYTANNQKYWDNGRTAGFHGRGESSNFLGPSANDYFYVMMFVSSPAS